MRTLATCFWKEWRDHRAVVVGFAAAIPALVLVARWLMPERAPEFPALAAGGAVLVALFAFVSELVPGEVRRERMAFLLRTPAGLPAVFSAKLLFLAAMLGMGAGHAFLSAWALVPPETVDLAPLAHWPWALAFALWVVAVSSWLPRGALAVPATLLLFVALATPLYVIAQPTYPMPTDAELATFQSVLGGSALLAAALSVLCGYRFGRGPWSAAWRGLGVVAGLAAGTYAYASARVEEWRTVDPESAEFRMTMAQVSPSGRYLRFLGYREQDAERKYSVPQTVVLDLATGAWRVEREQALRVGHAGAPSPLVERVIQTNDRGDDRFVRLLDAEDGSKVYEGWRSLVPPEVAERVRAARRATTPYRLRDGRRLWTTGGPSERRRVECEGLDGAVVTLAEAGTWFGRGLGLRSEREGWVDFDGPRLVTARARGNLLARPGRWLDLSGTPRLVDPGTGRGEPARGIGGDDRVGAVHDDGRVFVVAGPGRRLLLVDPESGGATPVEIVGGPSAGLWQVSDACGLEPARTPSGRRVYLLTFEPGHGGAFARFDPETASLKMAAGARCDYRRCEFVACLDEERALVVQDQRRLVEARFGGSDSERLFPR